MDIFFDLEQLASHLTKKRLRLATAESCTGGMIASLITSIPGCSKWFECGFIAYSNSAKKQCLSVDGVLINEYGVVSEPVAQAMAEGALKHSGAEVALATTGMAGPEGGSDSTPVGTVCFAWAFTHKATVTETLLFEGGRQCIRKNASEYALSCLIELLGFD